MRVFIVSALLLSLLAPTADASWPSDPTENVPLCSADGGQGPTFAVSDGRGGGIFAWADYRFSPPASSYPSVFAQRVDGAGGTHWAANGSAAFGNSTKYVNFDAACADGAGGAFLAWIVSPDTDAVKVQHIDASGVPTWGADGIRVGNARSYAGVCCLVTDGAGGVIVEWSSFEGDFSTSGVRGQRLDGSGVAQWAASGVVLGSATTQDPYRPVGISDGQGGAFAIWRQADGSGWEVFLQHVHSTGVVETGTGGPQIRSGTSVLPTPAAYPDGAHGAFIAWAEKDALGIMRLLAERVDNTGNALWLPNTIVVRVSPAPSTAIAEPVIVGSGSGDVILGWFETSGPTYGLHAQRVTPAGSPAWGAGGVFVCGPPNFGEADLKGASDGADGVIFAYVEYKSTGPPYYFVTSDITAARVTGAGGAPWAATGVGICTHDNSQAGPAIVADSWGGAIIAWEDGRWGYGSTRGDDIYMQNVRSDGTLGGDFAAVGPTPTDFAVRVWPVPSRGRANIAFTSPAGPASVTIVDVAGRHVRDVLRAPVNASEHVLRWDGTDESGAPVGAGLYFVRIRAGERETTRRIALVR